MSLTSKVNVFVIGVSKAGTTFLDECISTSRGISSSSHKEMSFFSDSFQKSKFAGPGDNDFHGKNRVYEISEYHNKFSFDVPWVVDISPIYFYDIDSITNILEYNNSAKFILGLRSPVERLISNYKMHVRDGIEPLSISQSLAQWSQREEEGWHNHFDYFGYSAYHERLKKLLALVAPENLLIYNFEVFKQGNYEEFKKQIEAFLPGVSFSISSKRANESRILNVPTFARKWLFRPNPFRQTLQRHLPKKYVASVKNRLFSVFGSEEISEKINEDVIRQLEQDWSNTLKICASAQCRTCGHWL